MNVQTIHLDIQCKNSSCRGFNYYEDETGYYVCADCNTISQIRCGLELDYTYPIRTLKSKIIKGDEDDIVSDDGNDGNNNNDIYSRRFSFEDETTTNNKSSKRGNSSFNDQLSRISKVSRKKIIIEEKTPQEKMIDIQNNFINIINVVLDILKLKDNEKKIFVEITRKLWTNFVVIKYKNIKNLKKNRNFQRSRENSLDLGGGEQKNSEENNTKTKISKKMDKKKKIRLKFKDNKLKQEIKKRRITERNIYTLYNGNKLSTKNLLITKRSSNLEPKENNEKKTMLKKFIDEYDKVINFIKEENIFDTIAETEEEKEQFNISKVIGYEQLIRVCQELAINIENESKEELNFESLIHLIFIKHNLNYKNKFNENNNEMINIINSNHILFLLYEILSYNKITILLNDILFNYKYFEHIKALTFDEVKYLYLLNNNMFKRQINIFDNKLDNINIYKKAENIIDKICKDIFKLPDIFIFFCKYIVKVLNSNEKIRLIILNKYTIEFFCIAVILYVLKIFYGLNDLPYICLILNHINKGYFDYDDIDLKEHIKIYKKNTKNDKLTQLYLSFPAELDIIKILIEQLKYRQDNVLIINDEDRKISHTKKFKDKYIDENLNYLYKNFNDEFKNDIDELEKKIQKKKEKEVKKVKKQKKWKIKKNEQFLTKIDKIENCINDFNSFMKEEFIFHQNIYKNEDDNAEYPLPFDTFIRMKKHAQKLLPKIHKPTELIFLFLFSEFFNIDYFSLKTLIKLIEFHLDKLL